MPAPLTLQEKIQRAEEKKAQREGNIMSAEAFPREDNDRPARKARGVFNGTATKLRVNKLIPGWHLHIFNDDAGRIQQALNNGYEFVKPEEVDGVSENVVSRNTDIGEKVRFLVGRTESGEPLYAYLMKIRQEWYDEDYKESQSTNDRIDDAIRSGKMTKEGTTADGFYIPKGGGIKIES